MNDSATLKPPVSTRDHIAGSHDAPVTLVEYGDYQCPYCGAVRPVIQRLQKALGKKLQKCESGEDMRNCELEIAPQRAAMLLAEDKPNAHQTLINLQPVASEPQANPGVQSLDGRTPSR